MERPVAKGMAARTGQALGRVVLLGATFLLAIPYAVAQTQDAAKVAARAPAATALTKEQVEAIAQRAFTRMKPMGMALAVVQDGQVLCEIALGERKAGTPMTPTSLFNIASCSKAFTAAILARLVDQKQLNWNDRVVDHVPEFRMADPWITAHMTIADLLSHRCGLKTFAGDLLWYGTDYTDEQVLAHIEKLPITQNFREQFGYQNLMYMVAGLVAQRITKQSWETLVEEQLMQPLGMTHSRASAQRLPPDAETARPHIDGIEIEDHVFQACKPAASIYASVHELTAWMRMLLADGVHDGKPMISKAQLAELWRPHVAMGKGSGSSATDLRAYGMGWFLYPEGTKKLVEHDGGMPGFLSKLSLLPADHFGFVVLNNSNDGLFNEVIKRALLTAHRGEDAMADIDRVAAAAARMQAQQKEEAKAREAARVEGTKPSLPLARYAGRFSDPTYGDVEVALDGEQLRITMVPSQRRLFGTLSHWHHDTFRVDFPDRFLPFALITFALDAEGKANRFAIDCPIADFDFGALDFRRIAGK